MGSQEAEAKSLPWERVASMVPARLGALAIACEQDGRLPP